MDFATKPKPVLVLLDSPYQKEIKDDIPFNSMANSNLLNYLTLGKVSNSILPLPAVEGIKLKDINYFYLDDKADNEIDDYRQEIKHKKELHFNGHWLPHSKYSVNTAEEIEWSYYHLEHKDIYVSYRLKQRLDVLIEYIRQVQPKLIICCGKWALYFLHSKISLNQTQGKENEPKPMGAISTYRASIETIDSSFGLDRCILLPIQHTVTGLYNPEKSLILTKDLQRACNIYNHCTRIGWSEGLTHYLTEDRSIRVLMTSKEILEELDRLVVLCNNSITYLAVDVETLYGDVIDIVGIATSPTESISFPLCSRNIANYWSIKTLTEIGLRLKKLLQHPNARVIGQNYAYDLQQFFVNFRFMSRLDEDTLLLSHKLRDYMPKDLAHLASLYDPHYKYWKDEA